MFDGPKSRKKLLEMGAGVAVKAAKKGVERAIKK